MCSFWHELRICLQANIGIDGFAKKAGIDFECESSGLMN
jgi:hypothetical protein